LSDIWLSKIKSDFESLLEKDVFSELEKQKKEINFLEIIDKTRSEIVHSNILAWLLDPKGSHCLGCKFVKSFFVNLALSNYINNYDDLEIIREKGLDDKFIDILIFSKQSKVLVGIENKIDSSEHSNQLFNYYNTLERDFFYFTNRFFIYLTPLGNLPSDKRWISCDYYMVLNIIENILPLNIGLIPKRVEDFLHRYLETLRRKIALKDTNIDNNWEEIYEIYFDEKGEYIRQYRENIIKNLISIVGKLVEKHKEKYGIINLDSIPTGDGNRYRFTTKKLDLYPKEGIKKYKNRFLHFDIWVCATKGKYRKQRDRVLVTLWIRPINSESKEIRETLLDQVNLNFELFALTKKGKNKTHHEIYAKYLWDLKSYSGIEKMMQEVERSFLDFLEGDLKKIEERLSFG